MMHAFINPIVYRIDENDGITFINSDWSDFAKENGLPPEMVKEMIGTSLWQHISNMTLRHLYQVLTANVRKTGKSVAIPFNGDSETMRRFMEMTIVRLNAKELEFRSTLIREEMKSAGPAPTAGNLKATEILLMCLWCKKVKASGWVDAEHAVHELKLLETAQLPLISHVICPDCESQDLRPYVE